MLLQYIQLKGPALVYFPASNFLHPPVVRLCAGLPRRLGPVPVRSLALAVGPFRELCPAASKEYSNASGYYSLPALRDIPLTLRIFTKQYLHCCSTGPQPVSGVPWYHWEPVAVPALLL